MAATIWRMTGIDTFGGGDLELSELRLWGATAALDAGATLTCSHAPISGALPNLRDDNSATTCRWRAADVRSPGFFIQWIAPAAVDFSYLKLGLVQAAVSPLVMRIESLVNGVFEQRKDFFGVLVDTAPGSLAVGSEWLSTLPPGFILVAAAGAGMSSYDYTNTTRPGWDEDFGQTINTGLFGAQITSPGNTGYLPTKTINEFSIYDPLLIYCANSTYVNDRADMDMEFLRADGSVVAAIRVVYRADFMLYMYYGSSLTSLTAAGSVGSYPLVHGTLSFTSTGMYWSPATTDNNSAGWGFSAPMSQVTAIRFSKVVANTNYASPNSGGSVVSVKRTLRESPVGYSGKRVLKTEIAANLILQSDVLPPPQGLQGMGTTGVKKLLDAEFGGAGLIYGSVARKATPANTPLSRRVRLHRSVDGYLAREVWSKADGSYEFRDISARYEWDVIAWDHELQEFSTVANNQLAEVVV